MKYLIFVVALAASSSAWAETYKEREATTRAKIVAEAALIQASQGPLESPASLVGAIQLQAGQDSTNATLRAAWLRSYKNNENGIVDSFTVTASSPLKKGEALLANLDGLTNATTVEFKISRLKATGLRSPNEKAHADICAKAMAEYKRKHFKDAAADSCDNPAFIKETLPDGYAEYAALFRDPSADTWIWGISAKAGFQSYKYYDAATLASADVKYTPWSASIFGSWQPNSKPVLYTAAYEYQASSKDADTKVLCVAGGSPLVCINGPVAAPIRERKELASFEARRLFPGKSFGVVAKATYDLRAEVLGVDVPVYLVKNDKDALTGGVRFGWRDDTDDFTASVFIGKPLSIFTSFR